MAENVNEIATETTTETVTENTVETPQLVVENMPDKKRYRAGQEIDFTGLILAYDGEAVTAQCTFDVEEGKVWRIDDKELVVTATYVADGEAHETTFTLKRELPIVAFLLAFKRPQVAVPVAAALLSIGITLFFMLTPPQDEVGSYIYPQGSMTDEEAIAMLNEQAEKSRITVSIRPTPELQDNGMLHVNFAVVPDNNDLSERLVVEQDGEIVYSSPVVTPGHLIEWGQSDGAHTGPATATVYAVTSEGADTGNPASAEIEIVAAEGGE